MKSIGTYGNREILWVDYKNYQAELPDVDWICLAVFNQKQDFKKFEDFVRLSISKNILEFKSYGAYCESCHDKFDEIVNIMEVMENHPEIDVMTTWHNDETLADVFWQCFHATCLPEDANLENLKVVCIDFDGNERFEEFENYTKKFENGWLP